MTKALRKAIMVKNNYNKNRTGKNWKSYKKTKKLMCKPTKEN